MYLGEGLSTFSMMHSSNFLSSGFAFLRGAFVHNSKPERPAPQAIAKTASTNARLVLRVMLVNVSVMAVANV